MISYCALLLSYTKNFSAVFFFSLQKHVYTTAKQLVNIVNSGILSLRQLTKCFTVLKELIN